MQKFDGFLMFAEPAKRRKLPTPAELGQKIIDRFLAMGAKDERHKRN